MVRVELLTERGIPEVRNAIAYIRLEEITAADRAATSVSEQTIKISSLVGGESFSFWIEDLPLRRDREYNVRAHVDVDADGEISPGDLISFQSHSLGYNKTDIIRIPLKQVRNK